MILAVILACYNRSDKTIACLHALMKASKACFSAVSVYVFDDGSTDGSGERIKSTFEQVTVLKGDGSYFWNGGMRVAFQAAMENDHDFYMWLNDDTTLKPNALEVFCESYRQAVARHNECSIITGSTQDFETSAFTYGGLVRKSLYAPLRFEHVKPDDTVIKECETMNGNIVLIPKAVAKIVGNLDPAFTHSLGDFDYGLRAARQGAKIFIAPGYLGYCSKNAVEGSWRDTSLGLKKRLQRATSVKGLPIKEWKAFAKRYGGLLWPGYFLSPYVKIYLSEIAKVFKRKSTAKK